MGLRTWEEDQDAKKTWEAMQKKSLVPKLKIIFSELDADGSSNVDLEELKNADAELQAQVSRVCDLDQLEEIFGMLDVDGSGSVSIDEFVDGIIHSQQADKPSELLVLMKMGRTIINLLQKEGGVSSGRRGS